VEDQAQLVQRLRDRLEDQGYELAFTDEQKGELDRRLAAYEQNPDAGSSWEEVKGRLWGGS
jgi:putative addiction module component (TIGR02574 family)